MASFKNRIKQIPWLAQPARAVLRRVNRLYQSRARDAYQKQGRVILSAQAANDALMQILRAGNPKAVGKIGSVELSAVVHESKNPASKNWAYISEKLFVNAGIYPPRADIFTRFARDFADVLGAMDVLAVWYNPGEAGVTAHHALQAQLCELKGLEPYYHAHPWSAHLAGKKVLVVHPFSNSIRAQYARREKLWPTMPDVLPAFTLDTVTVPASAALAAPAHPDWFVALEDLKRQMSARDFDIALIGAGAWSLPLAVHAKSLGKIGIHLGGATQILFGIRGARWDEHTQVRGFYNDAWIRPAPDETPSQHVKIEQGCYW